jgi:hypothetical protein
MTIEGKLKEKESVLTAQLKAEIESDRWWEMEFYFKFLGLGQMTKL